MGNVYYTRHNTKQTQLNVRCKQINECKVIKVTPGTIHFAADDAVAAVAAAADDNDARSVSVKRGLRVFYPQNLGQDAQKMKAVRQRMHIISFMTHKFKLPCVRLTR